MDQVCGLIVLAIIIAIPLSIIVAWDEIKTWGTK